MCLIQDILGLIARWIFSASQTMRVEVVRIMKKTKVNNEGWIIIGKKM